MEMILAVIRITDYLDVPDSGWIALCFMENSQQGAKIRKMKQENLP